jgi:hypothetical protein
MSDIKNLAIAQMLHGARGFGVDLHLDGDDDLVFDARYEPSEAVLERIAEHKDAIVALLKARQTAASIEWDRLDDISADEYPALVAAVKADISALQNSLDKLERAGAAILPTMQEAACSWGEAVRSLLAKSGNLYFARSRPKLVSDEEWLSALHSARLLGLRGPQPPRGRIP